MKKKKVAYLASVVGLCFILCSCHEPPPPEDPEPDEVPQPIQANIGVHIVESPPYKCLSGSPVDLVFSGDGQLTVIVDGQTAKPFHSVAYYRPGVTGTPVWATSSTFQGLNGGLNALAPQSSGADVLYLSVPDFGAYNISCQYMEWNFSSPVSGYNNTSNCTSTPPLSGTCWKWSKTIGLGKGTIPNFISTQNNAHSVRIDAPWDPKGGNCLIY